MLKRETNRSLIYRNQTSLQHFLRNKILTEYTRDKLYNTFIIYFAYE